MALITTQIKFSENLESLFDTTAHEAAKCIVSAGGKDKNKSTQLRKYYDELLMWEQKLNNAKKEEKEAFFKNNLPLIKMLNAKVAYARGRNLVTDEFVELMRHSLSEVNDIDSFKNCKLFFESFWGFFKYEEKLREEEFKKQQQSRFKHH